MEDAELMGDVAAIVKMLKHRRAELPQDPFTGMYSDRWWTGELPHRTLRTQLCVSGNVCDMPRIHLRENR